MSVVISIRVPKELKREMDELSDMVNWSEEIRAFLQRRVAELKRMKALRDARKVIENLPPTPRGTAVSYVRGDRESH